MNESVLIVKDLYKKYGTKIALSGVDLDLPSGRIVGLMGPNGSGKTTLIKTIAGLLKASKGEVLVCGDPVGFSSKALVSFLPDRNILPKWMTAFDAIDYYNDYFKDFSKQKALDMLDFMRLEGKQNVTAMSKGMVEKLNLTLCFSRQAKLYLLDEPLGGVDPVARERIVSTIVKTYNENSSIIVSTHLVHDIETMFDTVCFIDEGKVLLSGEAEDLRVEHGLSIDRLYLKMFSEKY